MSSKPWIPNQVWRTKTAPHCGWAAREGWGGQSWDAEDPLTNYLVEEWVTNYVHLIIVINVKFTD